MKTLMWGKEVLQMGKALLMSAMLFVFLTTLFCLLVWLTPLSERWNMLLCVAALSASCFMFGMFGGKIVGKRGIFVGIIGSLLFLAIILVGAVFLTQTPTSSEIFHVKYLPCILSGGIGGAVGVNFTSSQN